MPTSGYLFAIGASASYGLAQVITRQAVAHYAPPLVGAAISLFFGTLGVAVLSAGGLRSQLSGRGGKLGTLFFTLAGVSSSAGVILYYVALSQAPVVIVSPVLGVNPLVTLLFATIFLRSLERVTRRLVIGAVIVVLGVACIALATALHL